MGRARIKYEQNYLSIIAMPNIMIKCRPIRSLDVPQAGRPLPKTLA